MGSPGGPPRSPDERSAGPPPFGARNSRGIWGVSTPPFGRRPPAAEGGGGRPKKKNSRTNGPARWNHGFAFPADPPTPAAGKRAKGKMPFRGQGAGKPRGRCWQWGLQWGPCARSGALSGGQGPSKQRRRGGGGGDWAGTEKPNLADISRAGLQSGMQPFRSTNGQGHLWRAHGAGWTPNGSSGVGGHDQRG